MKNNSSSNIMIKTESSTKSSFRKLIEINKSKQSQLSKPEKSTGLLFMFKRLTGKNNTALDSNK